MEKAGKWSVKNWFISLVALLLAHASNAQEIEDVELVGDLLVFESPVPLSRPKLRYPRVSYKLGREGYALYNFMIAEDGTMYEPVLVESFGNQAFEKAALQGLESIEWQPAMLNGKPVESGHHYKITFQMSDQGARRSFIRNYEAFNEGFSNQEYEYCLDLIDEMQEVPDLNFYEGAYLNIAKYRLAKLANDKKAQLAALKSALAYENKDEARINYLPNELVNPLRIARFRLEVDLHFYAEALETYELIEGSDDSEAIANIQSVVDAIHDLKKNDVTYPVLGEISDSGLWFLSLFKQAFYIDQVEGQLDEIKLRCQAKYVFFGYHPEAQYSIPAGWGKCDAEIVGTPDTKFRVVQLNPQA